MNVNDSEAGGNSLAIRIPQTLAGQLSVEEGSEVELQVRSSELVIRPLVRPDA